MNKPAPLNTFGKKIHAALAQDIGSRILRGEFEPGSLLPNEAYWSSAFKISRSSDSGSSGAKSRGRGIAPDFTISSASLPLP